MDFLYGISSTFNKMNYTKQYYFPTPIYFMEKLEWVESLNKASDKFVNKEIKLKAIKGNLIIWPADFTHIHKSIISNIEEKYIATGWFDMIC